MLPLVTEFSLSLPEFSRFLKILGGCDTPLHTPTPPVATPLLPRNVVLYKIVLYFNKSFSTLALTPHLLCCTSARCNWQDGMKFRSSQQFFSVDVSSVIYSWHFILISLCCYVFPFLQTQSSILCLVFPFVDVFAKKNERGNDSLQV